MNTEVVTEKDLELLWPNILESSIYCVAVREHSSVASTRGLRTARPHSRQR